MDGTLRSRTTVAAALTMMLVASCGDGLDEAGLLTCDDSSAIEYGGDTEVTAADALTECVSRLRASAQDAVAAADSEVEGLREEVGALGEQVTAAEGRAVTAEAEIAQLLEQAEADASRIAEWEPIIEELDAARQALEARASELDGRETELEQRAAELDDRDGAISDEEEAIARSTIDSGVTWIGADADALPGTYRTDGTGSSCYWQISPQGQPDNIINNHFGNATGQSVTLTEGQQFESDGCGTWTRQ